jgi:AraC-like DNA-binding protein
MNNHLKKSQSDRVVEYVLTRNIDELETLSVNTIAEKLDLKRNNLWRCFKSEKKLTLQEYIFRIKIVHASSLLIEREELTVKEVGMKIGFYSYNYFIHIFKQYFGTTPGRYRELKKFVSKRT